MKSEVTVFPKTHFVYIEKTGPFQVTAQKAWQELHAAKKPDGIRGAMALYKVGPQIYRAGWVVGAKPEALAAGLKYEEFGGGKYVKFTYRGAYENLPRVSGEVWAHAPSLELRDDFAIENYVNSPETTPPNELITEIMLPTK